MADQNQLDLLQKGPKGWNEWRSTNDGITPDLSNAEFHGADLRGADLHNADLSGAQLREVNLHGADLSGADLHRVDLRGADVHEAELIGAQLIGTDLRWADLSEAILSLTVIMNADLAWANLSGALIKYATFVNVDLSEVKGLEDVRHEGPSSISVDTLYLSHGQIPSVFLRGCGLPDDFITYIDSFIAGKAIQFYSAFISYSSKDELFAKRLYADLQANKVRVWFAPEELKIGEKFRSAIDEAIRVYDKLIVVLSDTSVASDWVEKEVEAAFEKERREKRLVLFPIRIDETVMETDKAWAADIRRIRHIGDFTKWDNPFIYQNQINRLLRDLQAEATKPRG